MSAFEDACLLAANWLVGQIPTIAKSGIAQWGLSYPALDGISAGDNSGQDTGVSFKGLCGIGSTESGNAVLSTSGVTITGFETIDWTPDQKAAFTTPDQVMTLPLRIGAVSASGNFTVQQGCTASSQYTLSATGTFQAALKNADLVVTISGLNADTGSADAVTIAWADPSTPPSPVVTATITGVNGQPDGAPAPNKFAAHNFLTLGLAKRLGGGLTDLLSGATTFGSNQTLPGEILALINEGFEQL